MYIWRCRRASASPWKSAFENAAYCTVKLNVCVFVTPPPVPVTVRVDVPAAALDDAFSVRVLLPLPDDAKLAGARLAGAKFAGKARVSAVVVDRVLRGQADPIARPGTHHEEQQSVDPSTLHDHLEVSRELVSEKVQAAPQLNYRQNPAGLHGTIGRGEMTVVTTKGNYAPALTTWDRR